VLLAVREPRREEGGRRDEAGGTEERGVTGEERGVKSENFRGALRALLKGVTKPGILAIGAFIFLWNFNPFSTSVLYMHLVDHMGFSEQSAGNLDSVQAVGAIVASMAYTVYCRRLSVTQLVCLSIVMGVLATIGYWALAGQRSALAISFFVGFAYMTGMIVQLDLAARVCEIETAGTTFALLMSLSNLATALSTGAGGNIYEALAGGKEYRHAFNVLVGIGALFTCGCFLLLPVIRRYCAPKVLDA